MLLLSKHHSTQCLRLGLTQYMLSVLLNHLIANTDPEDNASEISRKITLILLMTCFSNNRTDSSNYRRHAPSTLPHTSLLAGNRNNDPAMDPLSALFPGTLSRLSSPM